MARLYRTTATAFSEKLAAREETLLHVANGTIGVRGTLEEGAPEGMDTMRGMYLNGFYEYVPMKQAEKLTHVSERKESMINAVDTQGLLADLDGETFRMWEGELLSCERTLDMDAGITERKVTWRAPSGRETELVFRRMASLSCPELFTIDCSITPLNYAGVIRLTGTHISLVRNYANPNDPRMAGESECHLRLVRAAEEEGASVITTQTKQSGLKLTGAVRYQLNVPAETELQVNDADGSAVWTARIDAAQGQTVRVIKYTVLCDSRRHPQTADAAKAILRRVYGQLPALYAAQAAELAAFWQQADMRLPGDEDMNRSMQFNLYQLFQSAGRDGVGSIAAKGLSGEGYEGHYFWDTEMYMMPFFTMTMPKLAKKLLGFRYRTLDAARENAKLLGHTQGALYPWRTIAGEECSGYFPAGTAQYHINGDIAYAVAQYWTATGDDDYLAAEGAEILLETARLWMDVGVEADGHFQIHCVTGPDEYTAMVNNNFYTNACARHNLLEACAAADALKAMGRYDDWAARLHVTEAEFDAFRRAAETMLLPYDEKLGINPQDDSFLSKKVWDIANTPKDHFPLLLHYHPMTLYRHQVCKQADTVLAHVLFEDTADENTRRKSFDYYERITTHDSSLSCAIFCIDACRLNLPDKAVGYFGDSVLTDLMDTHGNTKDGIHTANMGGCYMAVAQGFAGVELKRDGVHARPMRLPGKLSFRFLYRGSRLRFASDGDSCRIELEEGQNVPVTLLHEHRLLQRAGDAIAAKL